MNLWKDIVMYEKGFDSDADVITVKMMDSGLGGDNLGDFTVGFTLRPKSLHFRTLGSSWIIRFHNNELQH
jgi:hypothetical protein